MTIEVGNPASPEVRESVEFLKENLDWQMGIALFKYGAKIGGADVIFGEEKDSTLLGAFTLEASGLMFDPLKRELKPLPIVIA